MLAEGLALWRGPPLADFTYASFAQGEIARLEELRSTVLEEHLAAQLELGRHAELAGELEGLVLHNPLRERLRAQLMLALYRSGRQADALEAYADARSVLVEQLGIEPGRELRELQRAILAQDPELDRRAATTESQSGPEALVGRERELAILPRRARSCAGRSGRIGARRRRARRSARAGSAEELARQAAARGAQVLIGRCWEAGGAPAYWPWVQALRRLRARGDPAR